MGCLAARRGPLGSLRSHTDVAEDRVVQRGGSGRREGQMRYKYAVPANSPAKMAASCTRGYIWPFFAFDLIQQSFDF